MLTIQITMSGSIQRLTVDQFELVRTCRYWRCEKEFFTVDPDQLYCEPNHGIYQSKLRKILRDSAVALPLPQARCARA